MPVVYYDFEMRLAFSISFDTCKMHIPTIDNNIRQNQKGMHFEILSLWKGLIYNFLCYEKSM